MRIPVGYQKVPAENIKVDDVVREIGKVVDVWIENELEEWVSVSGRKYMMESIIIITESTTEGEYIDWNFPLAATFQVLSYAKIKNFSEDIDEFVTLNSESAKTVKIFSSSD